MSALDRLADEIAELRRRLDTELASLRLGVYQSDGTVLLPDGAAVTPAAILAFVEAGDTVLMGHYQRRAWVLGEVSPDGPPEIPEPYVPPTPALRLRAGQTSPVMNSTNKTVSVSYGATFATVPRVFVQFAQDMPDSDVTAEGATTTGFTLRLRGTATNNSVEVNWLAVLDGSFSI